MWFKRKKKIDYDSYVLKPFDRDAELEKINKEIAAQPKYYPTLWLGLNGLRFYPDKIEWVKCEQAEQEKEQEPPELLNTDEAKTVRAIQRWLNRHYHMYLCVDGIYGPETQRAVKYHQIASKVAKVEHDVNCIEESINKTHTVEGNRPSLKFKVGDLVKLKDTAFWCEASDGSGKSGSAFCYGVTDKYLPISIVNNKSWATHPYHIDKYGWVKESDIAEVIPHEPCGIESTMWENGWELYYHGVKIPKNVVYGYGPGELPSQPLTDTIYVYKDPHPETHLEPLLQLERY